MATEVPRIEYLEARRVLLDALDAMRAHVDALVLVGAQAVYLRSQGRLAGYQAFTTDADVVLDPSKLGPIPSLGQAMEAGGVGALLVAKSYKLGERLTKPGRLQAKDAGDLYRLFDATSADEMAATIRMLLDDERSARTTEVALDYARQLFMIPGGVGVQLAARALRGSLPEATVIAVITTYMREVFAELDR